jgi:hypothetical protein
MFLAITIFAAIYFREAIATVVSGQFVFHVFRKSLLQNLLQAILMAASSSDFFSTASDFVRSAAVLQEGQLEAADADEAQGGVLVRIHTNDYLASEVLDRLFKETQKSFHGDSLHDPLGHERCGSNVPRSTCYDAS